MTLPPCACGAPAFAFEPGREGIYDVFLLRSPRRTRAWCWACWLKSWPVANAEQPPGDDQPPAAA